VQCLFIANFSDGHVIVKSQVRSMQYDNELLFARFKDQVVYQSHLPGVICQERLSLASLRGLSDSSINVVNCVKKQQQVPFVSLGNINCAPLMPQQHYSICSILYVDQQHCYCCVQELSTFNVTMYNIMNGTSVHLGNPTTSSYSALNKQNACDENSLSTVKRKYNMFAIQHQDAQQAHESVFHAKRKRNTK